MKKPLFSVIIPAYNAENFICDALNSVANQTLKDYEIVVVDDGSTDATHEKVASWAENEPDLKIKIVRQANKGIGGARNTGIKNAEGVFVAFLDSDDLWLEQKLEIVGNHINANPLVNLICHDIWYQTDKVEKKHMKFGPYTRYRDLLLKDNSISTSATVVQRQKILDVGGFSEEMIFNGVEDYDLWLRLAKGGCRIEYLHKILSVYRDWGQGISHNISHHNRQLINVLENHFINLRPKTFYYRYLIRRRLSSALRGGGHSFMKRGNYSKARKYFQKAIKQDPFNLKTWVLFILNIVRISK